MTTVLCNAGPLIALGKLNRLELLAELYELVRVPRAVYDEAVTQGLALGMPDARTIRLFWQAKGWPIIEVAVDTLSAYKPSVILDSGETEVLALAQTRPDALVLLDDEMARSEARRLKLRVRGTLGVLAQAYHAKIISLPDIELLIQEIAARPDIWISVRLCEQTLQGLRGS
jgi:predicted nucleic acid-binding protein